MGIAQPLLPLISSERPANVAEGTRAAAYSGAAPAECPAAAAVHSRVPAKCPVPLSEPGRLPATCGGGAAGCGGDPAQHAGAAAATGGAPSESPAGSAAFVGMFLNARRCLLSAMVHLISTYPYKKSADEGLPIRALLFLPLFTLLLPAVGVLFCCRWYGSCFAGCLPG